VGGGRGREGEIEKEQKREKEGREGGRKIKNFQRG
jgi:hypothetical protein